MHRRSRKVRRASPRLVRGSIRCVETLRDRERFVPLFEAMAATFGVRLREPHEWNQFSAIMAAVLEGAALRQRVDGDFATFERATGPNGEVELWFGRSNG